MFFYYWNEIEFSRKMYLLLCAIFNIVFSFVLKKIAAPVPQLCTTIFFLVLFLFIMRGRVRHFGGSPMKWTIFHVVSFIGMIAVMIGLLLIGVNELHALGWATLMIIPMLLSNFYLLFKKGGYGVSRKQNAEVGSQSKWLLGVAALIFFGFLGWGAASQLKHHGLIGKSSSELYDRDTLVMYSSKNCNICKTKSQELHDKLLQYPEIKFVENNIDVNPDKLDELQKLFDHSPMREQQVVLPIFLVHGKLDPADTPTGYLMAKVKSK